MSKSKPAEVDIGPPCAACTGPHRLRHCDTPRAVALLTSAGLVMSAREVQARIEAKRGGAA